MFFSILRWVSCSSEFPLHILFSTWLRWHYYITHLLYSLSLFFDFYHMYVDRWFIINHMYFNSFNKILLKCILFHLSIQITSSHIDLAHVDISTNYKYLMDSYPSIFSSILTLAENEEWQNEHDYFHRKWYPSLSLSLQWVSKNCL